MGKYLHRYLNQSAFEADYNDETTPKYIEPWVSATNDDDELRVDYNKRRIIFEFDTEVTETINYSALDDSWSSRTQSELYPITGGDVSDFLNAFSTDTQIMYLVHNYFGEDAMIGGDMNNGGDPMDMQASAFGLSCGYGLRARVFKKTGTDELYLRVDCEIG